MPTTLDRFIEPNCPRCHSSGTTLFRSLRSSAVYLCRDCEHEWEGELPDTQLPATLERSSHVARA
jgi:ribosomal protein L37AE/L43A